MPHVYAGSVKRFNRFAVGSNNRSIQANECKDAAISRAGRNLGRHLKAGCRGGISNHRTCDGRGICANLELVAKQLLEPLRFRNIMTRSVEDALNTKASTSEGEEDRPAPPLFRARKPLTSPTTSPRRRTLLLSRLLPPNLYSPRTRWLCPQAQD